jgi:hypothetical protein
MAVEDITDRLVEGRGCGSCTLCCRVLGIGEILKPPGQNCPDCAVGEGCTIYERRPRTCRDFYCGFLVMKDLDEQWWPAVSKLILIFDGEDNRVRVHVDLDDPDAWRREPYYTKLKQWAVVAVPHRTQIIIRVQDHAFALLPDRDIDLGIMGDDDVIVTEETETPDGVRLNILKVPEHDPRATALRRPSPWSASGG